MGVAFKDLIISKEISLEELNGKIIFLDAFNILYQFLTTIRGRDGSLLTDSKGNVTSHLTGLFSRTANLLQKGIKPVFVFDGEAPELKKRTRENRVEIKQEAERRFLEAKKHENLADMKKYASRTTKLNYQLIDESKQLIKNFGIPIVQAPSEGEAQASYMAQKLEGYAVGSQDFDALIHGAPKLIRNLSVTGKRKKTRTFGYETITPEIIELSDNLNNLGIDQNQLICLAMLIGTDYNPKGIKGIGPKNALKLVKQHGNDFDSLFKEVKWTEHFDFSWETVYYLIKKIPTTDSYELEWQEIDEEAIKEFLVERHDFSLERVETTLQKLRKEKKEKNQKSLMDF
ncbi:flap endonuclease-1 [Candidatus Woesearchaeota archaeon]|nr:flap endonuclease-1 [Candidatus Woesearchaeota archaeon]